MENADLAHNAVITMKGILLVGHQMVVQLIRYLHRVHFNASLTTLLKTYFLLFTAVEGSFLPVMPITTNDLQHHQMDTAFQSQVRSVSLTEDTEITLMICELYFSVIQLVCMEILT